MLVSEDHSISFFPKTSENTAHITLKGAQICQTFTLDRHDASCLGSDLKSSFMHEIYPLDQWRNLLLTQVCSFRVVIFSAPPQVLLSMPGNTKEQTEALHYIPVSALKILVNGIHKVQTANSAPIVKKKIL